MRHNLHELFSRSALPRRMGFLLLTSALVAAALIAMLQGLLTQMRTTEIGSLRESYNSALMREIGLFEYALTSDLGCKETHCEQAWALRISQEFSWVKNTRRVPVQMSDKSDQALEESLRMVALSEQIAVSGRPVYRGGGPGMASDVVHVYAFTPEEPQVLRVAELSLQRLLTHINTTLDSQGTPVSAAIGPSDAQEETDAPEHTPTPLKELGVHITLTTPLDKAPGAAPKLLTLTVGALAGLLILAVGLVILEIRARVKAEDLVREQEERVQSSAKLATLGEIASMLSHELNQPLAAIESFASAAAGFLQKTTPSPQLEKCITQIRVQVERTDRILRSVHGFLQHRPQDMQGFDLTAAIADLRPLIELQASRIGAKLQLLLPPQVWITADKTMVEQVLLNLARNGIEAMRDQPHSRRVLTIAVTKKLGTRATSQELEHYPLAATPHIEISVTDRGMGISPEMRERLFMPFVSSKPTGIGIGLSICKTMAEKHQGHITFRDNPSGGTVFTLSLPDGLHASPGGT